MRKQPTQARSQLRVDHILEAAAEEFVESGLDASTNAIAARAGTSIGSVYQFFEDKDAILDALAQRYLADLAELHSDVPTAADGASLEEVLHPVVAQLVSYSSRNSTFLALFTGKTQNEPRSPELRVRDVVRANAERMLAHKNLPPERLRTIAVVLTELLRALLPMVVESQGAKTADELTLHLRAALGGYLAAIEAAPIDPTT